MWQNLDSSHFDLGIGLQANNFLCTKNFSLFEAKVFLEKLWRRLEIENWLFAKSQLDIN